MRTLKNVLAGIAIVACLVYVGIWGMKSLKRGAGESVTHRNFTTDRERIAFVQHHVPFAIPAGASGVEFKYDRFQDYHLEATFHLDAKDLPAFVKSLNVRAYAGELVEVKCSSSTSAPAIAIQPDGNYRFVTAEGYDTGTLKIDTPAGTVSLDCFSE